MNSGRDELQGYRLRACAMSDVGPRCTNQDRYILANIGDWNVFAVADGMGGGQYGAEAAAIAIEAVRAQTVGCINFDAQDTSDSINVMAEAIELAHKQVHELGDVNGCEPGTVGTTLTSLSVTPDLTTCIVTHVGDSRAYVYSRTRGFVHITEDHAVGNRLTRAITNDASFERKPDVGDFDILANETTVLGVMTDGLWSSAGEQRLSKLFRLMASNPENLAVIVSDLFTDSLVNATDNCTGIFAVIEPENVNFTSRGHFRLKVPVKLPWMK